MPSDPTHSPTLLRRIGNRIVKLEALQPGGSHKARAARFMLRRAIAEGALAPDQALILVKGAGTGASFQGIATRLREHFANVRCELVMPPDCDLAGTCHRDHPLEGFAVGVGPPFLDPGLIDAVRIVDGAAAREGQRDMARDIGFFPGMSSGANYAAARIISRANPDALVVTLAYDSGESYLPRPPTDLAGQVALSKTVAGQ